MNERGRPPEHSGGADLTPREAAHMLGVTEATVRNMIRRGELDGHEWLTHAGEPRYGATVESVQAKALELKRSPSVKDIDRRSEQILEVLAENFHWIGAEVAKNRQAITGAVTAQERELKERLDSLNEGLGKALDGMEVMRKVAAEQAEREQEYQRESLDIQREAAKTQERAAEMLGKALEVMVRVEEREREQMDGSLPRRDYRRGQSTTLFQRMFGKKLP